MKRIDLARLPEALEAARRTFHSSYYAMYSSIYGGIVTDPVLMLLPIDDHMVHRGDGVFEAFKCLGGRLYNMRMHLDRLWSSAEKLGIRSPVSREEMEQVVVETARAGGRPDCMLRLFLSRGPGSFGTNPSDCPAPQVYAVAAALGQPFMKRHPAGARGRRSAVPVKPPLFATMKSCNYLPNVLMAREAKELGVDFVIAFDDQGFMNEGATENAGIVSRERCLLFPSPKRMLGGTTMYRVMQLAEALVRDGTLTGVEFADIPIEDVLAAEELLVTGTTLDVVSIVEFEGRTIGAGAPGPVSRRLCELLERDIRENAAFQTPVF